MGQYKEALTTKDQFNCLGIARQLFLMPGTKNFVGAWQLALDFLGPEFKRPGIYKVFPGQDVIYGSAQTWYLTLMGAGA